MSRTIHMGTSPNPSGFDSIIDQELSKSSRQNVIDVVTQCQVRLHSLRSELMPHQLQMLVDSSKRKAAICTRRSGKTYHNRHAGLEAALANPWTNKRKAQPIVQYIAQTQKNAKINFWTPIKILAERIGLHDHIHWDDSNLIAELPNGAMIRAGGVSTREELEKYRGFAYCFVIIDEAASFGPKVENLVVESIGMALADYDGTIIMTGTPGQAKVGYFYEIYEGLRPEWSVQPCWSFMANTHLPPATRTEQWLVQNVGPLDAPRVRREGYGEWVTDSASLVYQYDSLRNEWDGVLPCDHTWEYMLGLDVGYRDPTAFVVGAFSRKHPWLFILHAEAHQHLLPSQIERKIDELNARYKFSRIVMDTGGSMARSNMEEWNRRSRFGIIPAEKTNKLTFIEHMNSEFYLGRIKVKKGLPIIKEWQTLPWDDTDQENAEKLVKRHDLKPKEHSGFDNHLADAALYMFRESRHYRSKLNEPDPPMGTPDYWTKMQERAKIEAFNNLKRQNKGFRYGRVRN